MTVLRPESSGGLADAIERILDKGLVINADISVSVGCISYNPVHDSRACHDGHRYFLQH